MKIGELAKRTGCQVVTIRYYEKEGLLAEPDRTDGNYRVYGKEDLERLEFIMHCRKHDMKLDEIRKLLAFRDKPQRDCTWVSELVDAHISNVDEQIRSLEHLKYHLEHLRERCAGGHSGDACGIMQSLDNGEECCASCERRRHHRQGSEMKKRITWPRNYRWLHEYALAKPDAELEYKESWDAMLYRLHGKIFALLLKSPGHGMLLNLKCDPYLSLNFRSEYPTVTPGWHMNKLHWVSLSLQGRTPEPVCRDLVDISYGLVRDGLPKWLRESAAGG